MSDFQSKSIERSDDEYESSSECFQPKTVKKIMEEETKKILDNERYDQAKSNEVTSIIVENIMKRINNVSSDNVKYISHALYVRSDEKQFDCYSVNYWEDGVDGYTVYDYNNGSIRFVITIWGLYC